MGCTLTTSFAFVPNSPLCLFEPKMSFVASLTPRALFLVRIVFTVALKRAVLSIIPKLSTTINRNLQIRKSTRRLLSGLAFVSSKPCTTRVVLGYCSQNKHGGKSTTLRYSILRRVLSCK